jgi:hypothetical protein
MTNWKPRTFLILGALATLGLIATSRMTAQQAQAPAAQQQGPRQQPPPPLDVQAVQELHQAYGTLELVTVWSGSGRSKLAQDQAALFEQAKELYRQAHRAYTERKYARSLQLALAAAAGSQGLVSVLHADAPPIPNLPKPPDPPAPPPQAAAPGANPAQGGAARPAQGPAEEARQVLDFARQRINDATKGGAPPEPAKGFLDASRKVYEQSRTAYQQQNYPKAIELALAAEAWTHVGEHLRQANNPGQPATQPRQAAPPRP